MIRHDVLSFLTAILLLAGSLSLSGCRGTQAPQAEGGRNRPNILLAISDDQSFPHASAYGYEAVRTPAFDRVAQEGVLFRNAYVASPGCSPSRAALLTGRYPWQIEEAGTHASLFPQEYVVFPDLLERAGYFVGATGKGWAPGDWQGSGRSRNPAGPAYDEHTLVPPSPSISDNDYAANFAAFLQARPEGQPFYFWYGAEEPHRPFDAGAGRRAGKDPAAVEVPPFLPDAPEVRSDMLDYLDEIEWFDRHLGRMLEILEENGELDNTIVIVTSDNGMAFPRAKANAYEYGIHVPLAIRWGARVPGGRAVDDLVSLVDLAPTLLEATGAGAPTAHAMTGRSLLNLLTGAGQPPAGEPERVIYAGRERHSSSRYENLSYPQRAVREGRYLYIRNFKPERWPAGAPQSYAEDGTLGPMHRAYYDIDAAPTQTFLVDRREDPAIRRYFHLAVDRRPAEELFDVENDPGCLNNLAGDPAYADVQRRLRARLERFLTETRDPRVLGDGDIFETYPRLAGPMRRFPAPDWVQSPADH